MAQGNYEEALKLVSERINSLDTRNANSEGLKIEDKSIFFAPEYITKAKILNAMKRHSEALSFLNENIYQYIKSKVGLDNFSMLSARTLIELAAAKNGLKNYDNALFFINKSIKILTGDVNPNDLGLSKNLYLANALFIRGEIFFNKKSYLEAIENYKISKDIYINVYGDNARNVNALSYILSKGVITALKLKNRKKSEIWAAYFYKLLINIFGINHPESQSISKIYYL